MDSRRSREIAANQGVVKRGILQLLRMIIFIALAYWLALWLFNNEYLIPASFYQAGIPREVPVLGLQLGTALAIVLILQLFYFFIYLWISPSGRKKAGTASFDESKSDQINRWDS